MGNIRECYLIAEILSSYSHMHFSEEKGAYNSTVQYIEILISCHSLALTTPNLINEVTATYFYMLA